MAGTATTTANATAAAAKSPSPSANPTAPSMSAKALTAPVIHPSAAIHHQAARVAKGADAKVGFTFRSRWNHCNTISGVNAPWGSEVTTVDIPVALGSQGSLALGRRGTRRKQPPALTRRHRVFA